MVSPMALICEAYRHSEQKRAQKICTSKRAKNTKTHPEKPKKGKTGCVLGAGRDGSRCGQMQTDMKTHCPNQCEHLNYTTHAKRKPAETQCFRRFLAGAEGLEPSARGFGVDVGERTKERRRARCHPVPAASPRKAGAGLVLRAILGEGLYIDYHFFLRKKSTSARRMAKLTRITAG